MDSPFYDDTDSDTAKTSKRIRIMTRVGIYALMNQNHENKNNLSKLNYAEGKKHS
jgi:hypothetical protein